MNLFSIYFSSLSQKWMRNYFAIVERMKATVAASSV